MKKGSQTDKDELRSEYKRSDFPEGFERGKYADRIRESSNIVVLKPEVAEVFPNEEAGNSALLSLINLAQKTTRPKKAQLGAPKNNIPVSRKFQWLSGLTSASLRACYSYHLEGKNRLLTYISHMRTDLYGFSPRTREVCRYSRLKRGHISPEQ